MSIVNTNKIVASALLFIFSSMTTPMIAAGAQEVADQVATIQQESVYTTTAPKVDLGIPRVVNLSSREAGAGQAITAGNKVVIRSLAITPQLIMQLKLCGFHYKDGTVSVTSGHYSDVAGGYVNLAPSDLRSGLVNIKTPQNALERNVQNILANPDQYGIRPDLVNVQLEPMIVSDTQSNSQLLTMESWDFRLVDTPHYSPMAVNYSFATAYSTFKAYADSMHKANPGKPVIVHTSHWGTQYNNNPKVTASMQILAAQLAGVDRLVFHLDTSNPVDMKVVNDAQGFVQAQSGNTIDTIMVNLLQQSKTGDWTAGNATLLGSISGGSSARIAMQ